MTPLWQAIQPSKTQCTTPKPPRRSPSSLGKTEAQGCKFSFCRAPDFLEVTVLLETPARQSKDCKRCRSCSYVTSTPFAVFCTGCHAQSLATLLRAGTHISRKSEAVAVLTRARAGSRPDKSHNQHPENIVVLLARTRLRFVWPFSDKGLRGRLHCSCGLGSSLSCATQPMPFSSCHGSAVQSMDGSPRG